jgi:hypothetical protein
MVRLRKSPKDTTEGEKAWGDVKRRLSGLKSGNEHKVNGRRYL